MTHQESIDDLAKVLDAMGLVVIAMSKKMKYLADQPVVEKEPSPADLYLSPKQAAKMLNLKVNTLAVWRMNGTGPKWKAINGSPMSGIRYHRGELEDFLAVGKN